MVAALISLQLLPCTLTPHNQCAGLSMCTFYPGMKFINFPLGFASCPKGHFWVGLYLQKREKPFGVADVSEGEKG